MSPYYAIISGFISGTCLSGYLIEPETDYYVLKIGLSATAASLLSISYESKEIIFANTLISLYTFSNLI